MKMKRYFAAYGNTISVRNQRHPWRLHLQELALKAASQLHSDNRNKTLKNKNSVWKKTAAKKSVEPSKTNTATFVNASSAQHMQLNKKCNELRNSCHNHHRPLMSDHQLLSHRRISPPRKNAHKNGHHALLEQ